MKLLILTLAIMMTMMSMVNGQCTTPLTAYGNSTIAPPVLDTQITGFIANPNSQNANDTRFLSFRISWATVSNRVLTYVGIGDDSAANGGCQSIVNANGGWSFNSGSDCFDVVRSNYTWPLALFTSSCAPLFTVDDTDSNVTKITFDLIVKFNETYTISRAGNTLTQVKTIASKLPVTLEYPKTVTVSTQAVRVYSASSVSVSADLISQDVTNTPPYNITFITLLGRSFALDSPVISYGGANTPLSDSITFTADTIISTTRQSTWRMAITPRANVCVLTGQYNITYNLYWTGVDANGVAVPANQNPLPNNSTVTVTFDIQSQSFCSTTITSSLVPTLAVFDVAPSPTSYYNGITERLGFFTNSRIYFKSQVTSDNLPLRTVRLTDFYITWGETNRLNLVINGTQATSSAPNIDYQSSLALAAQPNDQYMFNMLLSADVFQVLQDQDTQYVFNALLTVTYSTTGSKKKREVIKLSSGGMTTYQKRALPTTGSTSVTTTASITLQQTKSTSTPTSANIINTSSSSGLVASFISLLSLLVVLLW